MSDVQLLIPCYLSSSGKRQHPLVNSHIHSNIHLTTQNLPLRNLHVKGAAEKWAIIKEQ